MLSRVSVLGPDEPPRAGHLLLRDQEGGLLHLSRHQGPLQAGEESPDFPTSPADESGGTDHLLPSLPARRPKSRCPPTRIASLGRPPCRGGRSSRGTARGRGSARRSARCGLSAGGWRRPAAAAARTERRLPAPPGTRRRPSSRPARRPGPPGRARPRTAARPRRSRCTSWGRSARRRAGATLLLSLTGVVEGDRVEALCECIIMAQICYALVPSGR